VAVDCRSVSALLIAVRLLPSRVEIADWEEVRAVMFAFTSVARSESVAEMSMSETRLLSAVVYPVCRGTIPTRPASMAS